MGARFDGNRIFGVRFVKQEFALDKHNLLVEILIDIRNYKADPTFYGQYV